MSSLNTIISQINSLTGFNLPTASGYIISSSTVPSSGSVNEIVNQINKMTGVQWLVMRYHQRQGVLRDEDIEKAKEVEQAHIVKAYSSGSNDRLHNFINEQYYNETFKKSN